VNVRLCIRYQSFRALPSSIYIRNTCVLLYRVPCLWQGRFGIYFARAKHLSQPQKAKSRDDRRIVRFRFFERALLLTLNLAVILSISWLSFSIPYKVSKNVLFLAYALLIYDIFSNVFDYILNNSTLINDKWLLINSGKIIEHNIEKKISGSAVSRLYIGKSIWKQTFQINY